jgi:antitoxin (DNA-binding transcriptional repressor) of toxin-antitoxin stability system
VKTLSVLKNKKMCYHLRVQIIEVILMDTFTVRDLREHTGTLIHDAEAGKLSLITKHGRPVFLAVPFTQDLLDLGLRLAIAIKLYKEETLTLEKAAKVAGVNIETFIEKLGQLGVSAVDYPADEIEKELKDFG